MQTILNNKILYDKDKKRIRKAMTNIFEKQVIKSLGVDYNKITFQVNFDKYVNAGYDKVNKKLWFNYYIINQVKKEGFSDSYYKGRKDKLSFLTNNKKMFLFILLHELGHVKQDIQQKILLARSKQNLKYIERKADDYACNVIKKESK